VADTERRLNIFFDALNNETVPKDAVQKMGQISAGELQSPVLDLGQ
jgi:protein transport protein SEC31